MKLFERIKNNGTYLISFVGGGGKTSGIFYFRDYLISKGKKVLVTTTTAMEIEDNIDICFGNEFSGNCMLFSKKISDIKAKGISIEELNRIKNTNEYDYILCEADGAKRKAIKANLEYEPVISNLSDNIFIFVGAEIIGKKASDENVHRIEVFSEITGLEIGKTISEESVIKCILSERGLMKGVYDKKASVFFNKIELISNDLNFDYIADELLKRNNVEGVYFTNIQKGEFVRFYEK